MNKFTESVVEEAALAWLEVKGWTILHGPEIASGMLAAERTDPDFRDVVLERRLRQSLQRLNPNLSSEAIETAFRKLTIVDGPSLLERNRAAWRMLVDGVAVEITRPDGSLGGYPVKVVDFNNPDNNDWVAVNQFTVREGQHVRRPDILLYLNGLPIAGIELKNATDEKATIWTAYDQFQTYKHQIPSLYVHNALLCISDGMEARVGSLTSPPERFLPWRTIEGEKPAPATIPQLRVVIEGLFDKQRLLDFLHYFIVFEEEKSGTVKKIAAYHQFHAVNHAIDATVDATSTTGDKRAGVVWHTQGSGKSLTMVFYAGRLALDARLQNPTIVVLTDRNDLDDQLFGTFSRCHETLHQPPMQAESREHLRQLLNVSSGGIVFTTIQKFAPAVGEKQPELTDRRNVIVIADEAHRSQYDFIDGYARHMRDALPGATFIGFTGTPIERTDASTTAVFGDTISVYDIQRAVEDGSTVPIYYENRLVKLNLDESLKPQLDSSFDEATETEEVSKRERLKTRWAAVEAIVGTEKRLKAVAKDLVEHFEARQQGMIGKGMIVCMSRRICVELYRELIALRPEWHRDDDKDGAIKIVMTGSATDPVDWQEHIRNKERRVAIGERFKNPKDPLKLVIVRDMWLTGFDVPCLHTMYVDKYMHAHGLMQAIARVNRVFRDKPGGLVVDYLGIAQELKKALTTYTEEGGEGDLTRPQHEAVELMLRKHQECCTLFEGFNWSGWSDAKPSAKLELLPGAQEHILAQREGKEKLSKSVAELSHAFALAVPHEDALRIRDDVGFFQAVKAVLAKSPTQQTGHVSAELAIRQIVSNAIISEDVIDIFAAAGLKKPDISILSDEFLAEIQAMPQRNLAVELLQKLLKGEIKTRSRRNVVQARKFSDLIEASLRRYQNRAIETAQVIEELIELAKDLNRALRRGESLNLNEDELAFYDALEVNDSAVQVLGDASLRKIAKELVENVRKNATLDWTQRENVQAKLRVIVKRILKKYGYPPDKQEKATQTVLEQAEVLSEGWAVSL
ncbi:MAG TPA: type I restriction endonuclease subunit R [Acidobacteriaceae bacterium]|jgi:type I restriction enzyme R subunit|nr:type I restriction endonuclease subunit R [Acidobacteriaceae bacterium]